MHPDLRITLSSPRAGPSSFVAQLFPRLVAVPAIAEGAADVAYEGNAGD
eukprot:COSAG02_NODE_44632_length_364_cov_1.124528_1_plen_48_part_01